MVQEERLKAITSDITDSNGESINETPAADTFSVTGSDGGSITLVEDSLVGLDIHIDAAKGDTVLPYTVPHAEYMYGCAATSVGMLLGYYDLYGYRVGNNVYNMSKLIPGTISVNSRGSDGGSIYDMKDPSVLANFIASQEYVSRFYSTTPAEELPYTFINSDPSLGLNISVWNCLADCLGTGQYWRSGSDLGTTHYNCSLEWLNKTSQTYTVDGLTMPIKFADFKYGLSLYTQSMGYHLDEKKTESFNIGSDGFTYDDYKAEIDAGRPVLLSMNSTDGGHMVLGYGYNADTQEVIFDDTYRSDCRMSWTGTYNYSNNDYTLRGATTIVFSTDGLTPISSGGSGSSSGGSSGTTPVMVITGAVISGYSRISAGVKYTGTTIVDGGYLYVYSGASAETTTVDTHGHLYIYNGGVAATATVSSGGVLGISSGGKLTGVINISSGAVVSAYTGSIVDFDITNVAPESPALINDLSLIQGTPDYTITVSTKQTPGIYTLAGGVSDFDCTVTIRNTDGVSDTFTVGETITLVRQDYTLNLDSDTQTLTLTVGEIVPPAPPTGKVRTYNGNVPVLSADILTGRVLYNGNTENIMYVYSGGTANSTVVSSGGRIYVSNGGVVNSTVVNSAGDLHISAGGTANDTTVKDMGFIYISKGGAASNTIVSDGRVRIAAGTAENTIIDGGSVFVSSGGVVNEITVSNGLIIVSGGGEANDVNVKRLGEAHIRGGKAAGVAVNTSGNLYVSSGGEVSDIVVNTSGNLYVSNGGEVSDVTVNGYGGLFVAAEAAAQAIIENGGYVDVASGAEVSFIANSFSEMVLSNAAATLHSGTTANSTTVIENGSLQIYSGGVANATVIDSKCSLYVNDGGTADSTTVNSRGSMYIFAGAETSDITVNSGGSIFVSDGASAQGILENGGYVKVADGAEVSFVANSFSDLVLSGASATLHSGTTANSTVLNVSGSLQIYSGGVANDTIVNNRGRMYIYDGGEASGATVSSRGSMYVSNGGTADDITVNRGGVLDVSDGGKATIAFNPWQGTINTETGADVTYLERDAAVYYGGRVGLISKGDLMAGLTLNSGYSALIYSGGAVNETTVNSSGSVIVSGGVVNSATVNSRGSMFVSNGGKVTGKFNICSGATVSAYAGSIIDFDISETSAGDPERVNDLSNIQGDPDYTATVIASIISSQQLGQYTLAGGAENFEKTVMLRSEAAGDIAELSLRVTSFNWWRSYTLDSTDSMLTLTIGYIAGTAAAATPLNRDGETIRGTDRAARWTSDTEVDADTIFVVDANFGGDAWLDIDGADLSGKVLYGASENYSGAVNINVGSGKLHNLAAGAAAGGGVAGVNLILGNTEVSGAIYAGGFGDVSGEVNTWILGGTLAKDVYAGALASKNADPTAVGDVSLTIEGGIFSGNIYGASAVKTVSTIESGVRHTAGDVTVILDGGEATGNKFCCFAGGYANGSGEGTVYTVDSVTVDVSGGVWGKEYNWRGIFGGIFVSQASAKIGGDVNINISGGTIGNVYGGGWAQKGGSSEVDGEVNITVTGGSTANIFGSGVHSTSGGSTSVGDIIITLAGGNVSGNIYAGSVFEEDRVTGTAVVTVTGDTDYGCNIFGRITDGGTALVFSDYTGSILGSEISGFDRIGFSGATATAFSEVGINNTAWDFDLSERDATLADTVLASYDAADFADCTITLQLGDGQALSGDWSLFAGGTETTYGDFDVTLDGIQILADTIALDEQISGTGTMYDGWGFTLEESVLKFKQLA